MVTNQRWPGERFRCCCTVWDWKDSKGYVLQNAIAHHQKPFVSDARGYRSQDHPAQISCYLRIFRIGLLCPRQPVNSRLTLVAAVTRNEHISKLPAGGFNFTTLRQFVDCRGIRG